MSTLRSIATPSRNFRNERVFPLPDATSAPTAALCFKWLPGPVRLGVSEKMGWKKLGCCFLKVFAVHHFWGCLMISEHIRMWFLVFWALELLRVSCSTLLHWNWGSWNHVLSTCEIFQAWVQIPQCRMEAVQAVQAVEDVANSQGIFKAGWWFQTWSLFSIIYGIILPIDFHIFQDGYCTTNQKACFMCR